MKHAITVVVMLTTPIWIVPLLLSAVLHNMYVRMHEALWGDEPPPYDPL